MRLGPAQPVPAAAPTEASQDAVRRKEPPRELEKSTCGLAFPDDEVPPPKPDLEQQQGSGRPVHGSRSKVSALQQPAASAAGRSNN